LYSLYFTQDLFDGFLHTHVKLVAHQVEGYVVRLAEAFSYGVFRRSVGKYVRAGHDRTRPHWFYGQAMVVNGIGHRSEMGEEPQR
jgi:hypothetical protein